MAVGLTDQFLAELPSPLREKVSEALLYLEQGLFEEARAIFQELIEVVPSLDGLEDPQGCIQALQQQIHLIEKQEAEFLGTAPPEADAAEEAEASHYERAQVLRKDGDLPGAVIAFRQAAESGYQVADCLLQIGKLEMELGNFDAAVAILEEALQLPNLEPEAKAKLIDQLSLAHQEAEKTKVPAAAEVGAQEAVAAPQTSVPAAQEAPGVAEAGSGSEDYRYELNLARLHLKNNDIPRCLRQMQRLRHQYQVSPQELAPICQELLHQEPHNTEAVAILVDAAEGEADLDAAKRWLAPLLTEANPDQATRQRLAQCYRSLLEQAPQDGDLRLGLARTLLADGAFEAAMAEYMEVLLGDSPLRLAALCEAGEALLARRQVERALDLLETAVTWVEECEPSPQVGSFFVTLGKACEQANRHDQAQAYFAKAAAADPENEQARARIITLGTEPLRSRGNSLLGLQVPPERSYEVKEVRGRDDFLEVFRVTDPATGVAYTARSPLPHVGGDKVREAVRRWAYELSRMENRNILVALDLAEAQGRHFLITRDYEHTLEELLRQQRRLSLTQAVRLARSLLNALAYAHSHRGTDDALRKIFHLALTPERIVLSGDVVTARIADFGLLTALDAVAGWHLPFQERRPADLAYMAPEQFDRPPNRMPEKMKQAADIYAFGIIFYRTLTGQLPFSGPNAAEFRQQHAQKYPVPPRVHESSIPGKLDELILRCLHKQPKKRWRTPTELDLALEKIDLSGRD